MLGACLDAEAETQNKILGVRWREGGWEGGGREGGRGEVGGGVVRGTANVVLTCSF